MAGSVEDILQKYAQDIIEALQKNLVERDRFASGNFSQSIIANVEVLNTGYTMTVSMDDYWKFIDEGVDGTKVKRGSPYSFKKKTINPEAALRFVRKHNIQPRKKGLDIKKARKGLAYVIGKSIAEKGLKATKFATDVFESELIDNMNRDILEATGKEIVLEIKKGLKQ